MLSNKKTPTLPEYLFTEITL